MECIKIIERNSNLIEELKEVWYSSVCRTHTFLSKQNIDEIAAFVPQAIKNVEFLITLKENNRYIAFMGIEKQRLEMLFIAPEYTGKGLGRKLLEYGFKKYRINEVTVNEQNPKALGFYKHMGFKIYKRNTIDEQGRPFPILYMKK